jgi:hypothetical protein
VLARLPPESYARAAGRFIGGDCQQPRPFFGNWPFGARGIGEPPIGPPIAAVASAIADALGVRPATLPITPERVLKCLARSSSNTAAS